MIDFSVHFKDKGIKSKEKAVSLLFSGARLSSDYHSSGSFSSQGLETRRIARALASRSLTCCSSSSVDDSSELEWVTGSFINLSEQWRQDRRSLSILICSSVDWPSTDPLSNQKLRLLSGMMELCTISHPQGGFCCVDAFAQPCIFFKASSEIQSASALHRASLCLLLGPCTHTQPQWQVSVTMTNGPRKYGGN